MKLWEEHPMVLEAEARARRAEEPTTLRKLEELLGLMNEIEERFPGVPFRDVLRDPAQTPGYDLARVRRTLAKNGACPADIALVCPMETDHELRARRAALKSDPYHELAERL